MCIDRHNDKENGYQVAMTDKMFNCCGVVLGQGVGLALGTTFSRPSTTQPFLLSSSLVSSLE
jgi:hypothetical protein